MRDFEYIAPQTLREAIKALDEHRGQARILAGGTDLLVQMRTRRIQPEWVVDVKGIPELNELSITPRKGLTIGAAVSCRRIYSDPEVVEAYPGVVDSASIIGGIQIQGRATFGGNLCNASPSGDSIPMLIAYGAQCHIAGPGGKRVAPVESFCTGPGVNALEDGELLVAIRIPPRRKNSGCHYLRFIPRNEMDIAVAGAGAYVELGNRGKTFRAARLALGAVAATPLYAREASETLVGEEVSDETVSRAIAAAQQLARPITDMRGPAQYRTHLVGVLTRRALEGAVRRARGEFVPNAVQDGDQPRAA